LDVPRIPTDADLFALPPGLPAPSDDGAARHLLGQGLPSLELPSTGDGPVNLRTAARELAVFFCYPATLAPGVPIPGEWSEIPGARGCTIQNLGYRELYARFRALGCAVYGVSGQGTVDPAVGLTQQRELVRRLGLPFDLLNDSELRLARALRLPTFRAELAAPRLEFEDRFYDFPLQGRVVLRRLTFVARNGTIERVFYPVFPPDRDASTVLAALGDEPLARSGRGTGPVPTGPSSARAKHR
jgi:peroxiredoxin